MLEKIKERKKGFTLIEIIVALVLITLISVGSIVGIKTFVNKSNDKFYKQFDNALEIYLSDHSEIYTNLSDNVEGAVVTLEVLKNEGLIKENIIDPNTDEVIDYSNNYYVLSDAVINDSEEEHACEGQVELSVISSWESLSGKVDTSKVLYVCPRDDNEEKVKEEDIDDLKKRLESLESQLSTLNLGGDNWILFDVNTNENAFAYWPEENQDLWAYVGIDNSKKEIKLIYNNYVGVNNRKTVEYTIDSNFPSRCNIFYNDDGNVNMDKSLIKVLDLSKSSYTKDYRDWSEWDGIFEYDEKYYYYQSNWYSDECEIDSKGGDYEFIYNTNFGPLTKIDDDNGWSRKEIEDERYNSPNSKKKALFDAIKDTSNIVSKKYYYGYLYYDTSLVTLPDEIDVHSYYEDKLGNINSVDDNIKNIRNSLVGLNFYMGSYKRRNMNGYVFYRNGIVDIKQVNDLTDDNSNDFYYTYSEYRPKEVKDYKVWGSPGYYTAVNTINYIPVITIKYNSLMNDINTYPASYKTKCAGCTNENLGTKECPYIVKMANGNLSWS